MYKAQPHPKYLLLIGVVISTIIGISVAIYLFIATEPSNEGEGFNKERAFADVVYQVELGPRLIGSRAHEEIQAWIVQSLEKAKWQVSRQVVEIKGAQVVNIIGHRESEGKWILLGAHYDTRLLADRDADLEKRNLPVLGANDGASGVAVLLELARILPQDLNKSVSLVFFDAEDNGGIGDWDWVEGSRIYVDLLNKYPDQVVIVDMVGDADLQIFFERNSDERLAQEIWAEAESLGYGEYFIPTVKHAILDDHLPFVELGITAVDIIDFDYPYWHTSEDTLDKVSPESLEIVGKTLLTWLTSGAVN
jgi:Zn-dependent M28 family amino/carboxypeptidase